MILKGEKMSVECNKIKGFTITLPMKGEKLSDEEYDKYNDFEDENEEYYFNGFRAKPNRVYLIIDGMCSGYARLVYAEQTGTGYDYNDGGEDEQYYSLKAKELTDDIYNQLNTAYEKLMGKPLNKEDVDYALWYYWW